MKLKKLIILILLISILSLASCNKNNQNFYQTESFNMGTIVTQKLYGNNAKIVSNKANDVIHSIETMMTANANIGDIYNLNANAGNGKFISISQETYLTLQKSKTFHDISEGTFNIMIGPIVKLWGIGTKNARVPTQEEISKNLELVGINNLELNDADISARLKTDNCQIDLGAIAKGYATDKVIEEYKKNGIKSAYINLGGNVFVLGTKPDGRDWNIGIQNPLNQRGNTIGYVNASNKAIVTSGSYERYFESNGKKYHHILDPKTGYPCDSDLLSTTIIANNGTDADALSTSTFLLGLDKGMDLINKLNNVGAIFVTKDKKIYVSDNIADKFVLSDESGDFIYVKKR